MEYAFAVCCIISQDIGLSQIGLGCFHLLHHQAGIITKVLCNPGIPLIHKIVEGGDIPALELDLFICLTELEG